MSCSSKALVGGSIEYAMYACNQFLARKGKLVKSYG